MPLNLSWVQDLVILSCFSFCYSLLFKFIQWYSMSLCPIYWYKLQNCWNQESIFGQETGVQQHTNNVLQVFLSSHKQPERVLQTLFAVFRNMLVLVAQLILLSRLIFSCSLWLHTYIISFMTSVCMTALADKNLKIIHFKFFAYFLENLIPNILLNNT